MWPPWCIPRHDCILCLPSSPPAAGPHPHAALQHPGWHIHWHANGEAFALRAPGLQIPDSPDSPRLLLRLRRQQRQQAKARGSGSITWAAQGAATEGAAGP